MIPCNLMYPSEKTNIPICHTSPKKLRVGVDEISVVKWSLFKGTCWFSEGNLFSKCYPSFNHLSFMLSPKPGLSDVSFLRAVTDVCHMETYTSSKWFMVVWIWSSGDEHLSQFMRLWINIGGGEIHEFRYISHGKSMTSHDGEPLIRKGCFRIGGSP